MVLAVAVARLEDVALVGQVYVDDGVVRRTLSLATGELCPVILLIRQLRLARTTLNNLDRVHHRTLLEVADFVILRLEPSD